MAVPILIGMITAPLLAKISEHLKTSSEIPVEWFDDLRAKLGAGAKMTSELIKTLNPSSYMIAFSLFIYEEAVQAINFGIWQAMNAGDWEVANNLIGQAQGIIDAAVKTMSELGGLVPFALPAYQAFFNASFYQVQTYKTIIIEKSSGNMGTPLGEIKAWYKAENTKLKLEHIRQNDVLMNQEKREVNNMKAFLKRAISIVRIAKAAKQIDSSKTAEMIEKLEKEHYDFVLGINNTYAQYKKDLELKQNAELTSLYDLNSEKITEYLTTQVPPILPPITPVTPVTPVMPVTPVTPVIPEIPAVLPTGANIISTPIGATIIMDGSKVGVTDMFVPLVAGTHRVRVFIPGYVAGLQEFTAKEGKQYAFIFDLVRMVEG